MNLHFYAKCALPDNDDNVCDELSILNALLLLPLAGRFILLMDRFVSGSIDLMCMNELRLLSEGE